jgi:hypothetical protein
VERMANGLDGEGPLCVMTSWTLGYLDMQQRRCFVDQLAAVGAARGVAWLSFEHPGVVSAMDARAPTTTFTISPSLAGLTTFGPGGVESQRPLAHVHPHGSALEWTRRR